MGDLFEDYAAGPAWDEMFDPTGGLRPGYAALHELLAALGVDDLAERGVLRDRSLRDQGITFTLSGEERPIPLDLLPRVISAEEWAVLEYGVGQRVRALEAFLADVQDPGSPRYHQFLTQDEFNAFYAPDPAEEAAVVAHLAQSGLTVTERPQAGFLTFYCRFHQAEGMSGRIRIT